MAPPRQIGRYLLFDSFAHGGMASVCFGRLDGSRGRAEVVAIKRHHEHLTRSRELVAMIRDEARITSRIRHPNVVAVRDVVAQHGELLLVMDYVAGLSLAELLRISRERGERVPVEVIAAILVGVLQGLHAAHQACDESGQPLGVVHCDVSPQNVLVGADGFGRITDFGIAFANQRDPCTRHGELKGKLEYMAREQIRREPVDERTDVYAASVVLWEALAGRRLFEADDAGAVFARVVAARVVAPSVHQPRVPRALDQLVLSGLSPNRSDRPRSAREMALALAQATRLASEHDVAAWVMHIAGPEIEARARRVRAIQAWEDPNATTTLEAPTLRYRIPAALPARSSIAPTSVDVAQPKPRSKRKPWGQKFSQDLGVPLRRIEISFLIAPPLIFNVALAVLALHRLPSSSPAAGPEGNAVASFTPRPAPTPFEFDLAPAPAREPGAAAAPRGAALTSVKPKQNKAIEEPAPVDPAVANAKDSLKAKVLLGAGTAADKRALRGACRQLHDSSCSN